MVIEPLTEPTVPGYGQSQQAGFHRRQGRRLALFVKRLVCLAIENDHHLSFSFLLTADCWRNPGSKGKQGGASELAADFNSLKQPVSASQ
jgi:hypothetical protein